MWLVIRHFNQTDIGTYKCISTNSIGKAEGTLRLYSKWRYSIFIYNTTSDQVQVRYHVESLYRGTWKRKIWVLPIKVSFYLIATSVNRFNRHLVQSEVQKWQRRRQHKHRQRKFIAAASIGFSNIRNSLQFPAVRKPVTVSDICCWNSPACVDTSFSDWFELSLPISDLSDKIIVTFVIYIMVVYIMCFVSYQIIL